MLWIKIFLETMYDQLVMKVNGIVRQVPSTTGLINEPQNDTDQQNPEKKIEDFNEKRQCFSSCQFCV